MKRAGRQIAACAGILILFCLVCRLTFFRSYTAYIPLYPRAEERLLQGGVTESVAEGEGVAHPGEIRLGDGYVRLPIHPDSRGHTVIEIRDRNGDLVISHGLRVGPLRTVYDEQTGGFTGDAAVLIAVTLFWWLVFGIMLWNYFQNRGPDYYAYSTIYFAGFSLLALVSGIVMTVVTAEHLISPAEYSMRSAYSAINSAGMHFMMITLPAVVVFAAAMGISNIVLLRHVTPRVQNVLGLVISVLLLAGEALGVWFFMRDFSGSEWEGRVQSMIENVYATAFVYFECMLAGSVICGIRAARYQPAPDKDAIIILGCWFRKDGTLPPLLRGRVDRALAFWRNQKEKTGKEAFLIPSGGQGRDEPMPEAEAMRRYLTEQQIPERLIRPETRSENTFQNMAYSREIMDELCPEGKVAYATTNYHVFRSGVWAGLAGLRAEGIGGKTRWWFWPNAFMRECAGLLQKRWKQELLGLALLMLFFGALTLVLG